MIWCDIEIVGFGGGYEARWSAVCWEETFRNLVDGAPSKRRLFGLRLDYSPTHMAYRLDESFEPAQIIASMTRRNHDRFYFDDGSNGRPIYCTRDELKRVFETLGLIDKTEEHNMQETPEAEFNDIDPETPADEDKELTLEEFEVILRKDVETFVASWRQGMSTQPDIYASVMTEGEWGDQWMSHVTMGLE